ncbi:MAG: hypothetical protein HQK56_11555 [Deltaproteobacteria bacterium]|nr:hypothetical protein [Deltaproteobacteria bacterium]
MLYRMNSQGSILFSVSLTLPIRGISLDATRFHIWVATQEYLTSFDESGQKVLSVDLSKDYPVRDISFDSTSDALWVASNKMLHRYAGGTGALQFETSFDGIGMVSADGSGGVWAAGKFVAKYHLESGYRVRRKPHG